MISLFILFASIGSLSAIPMACENQVNDITILLDSSESIAEKDYNFAKDAVINTINSLTISQSQNRVAFIQFGTDSILKFNLDTFDNAKDMIEVVKTANHTNGLTAIGKALRMTVNEVLPKMRMNITRVVTLITDGTNTMFPAPQLYADTLKKNNVRVVCIGIGSEINKKELELLASDNSLILASNFGQLQQEMKRALDHMCYLPDPEVSKPCTVPQQDLVFVVDSSSSLTQEDFENSKRLVKLFINHTQLGENDTRVAMLSFSETVRLDFNLDAYTKEKDYDVAIDKALKFGVATAIGAALQEVLTTVWPKHRDSVPFNVILLTDGINNRRPSPSPVAMDLKKIGANIVSVGIGKDFDFEELQQLSSNNKIVTSLNYKDLVSSVVSVERVVTCG